MTLVLLLITAELYATIVLLILLAVVRRMRARAKARALHLTVMQPAHKSATFESLMRDARAHVCRDALAGPMRVRWS